MNFDSFSHGQIKSKLWLCDTLEPLTNEGMRVRILGSWHNVLGFMLLTRRPTYYQSLEGIDIDNEAISVGKKITEFWYIEGRSVFNTCANACDIEYDNIDLVINCSPEHMENTKWFDKILKGTMVCIQSSDMNREKEPWLIKHPHTSLDYMHEIYPFDRILFFGTQEIKYDTWGYNRNMIIGIK